MQHALSTKEEVVNIGHAGTAMRFLTSYFAVKDNREVVLTGSERMQNRPIEILVDALKDLGADISYEDKIGYPPIRIKGRKIVKDKVQINGNVSSQYISSMLLIASKLENGLEIVEALNEKSGFLKSNGEARRALKENSISVNKEKVKDDFVLGNNDLIADQFILLQRGKRNYFLLKVV